MKKGLLTSLVLFSMLLIFTSCSANYKQVKRMQKMEEGVSNPVTIEELEEAIEKYDKRALDLATTEGQQGMWYKILGTRYLDQKMYGKAFESFQKALIYYPDNANLYYYIGICAGYLSKSALDFEAKGPTGIDESRKNNYLRLAESSYLQALQINPKYYRTMYAISVLYVFELKEYSKAIPHLEKYLETQTKDTNAMFMLASCYYVEERYSDAVEIYDKIIKINPNPQKTAEAEANKKVMLDNLYGKEFVNN